MIPEYIIAGLWGAVGSFALILGSFFGYSFNLSKRVIAFISAFSSGILISAVCFELLYKANSYGDIYSTMIGFTAGVVIFTVKLVTKMMEDKIRDENFHIKELGRVCNVRTQRIFFFVSRTP
jgi:zinc transporter ZupT